MTDSTALTTTTSNNQALAECHANGRWPGYGDLVQEPIELPGWCRD